MTSVGTSEVPDIDAVDVVVVGGGMAGLAAALVAAEDGASTLCLERLTEPGGSLALSGGYIWTVGGLDEYRRLSPEGDADIARMIIDELDDGRDVACSKGRVGPAGEPPPADEEVRGDEGQLEEEEEDHEIEGDEASDAGGLEQEHPRGERAGVGT